MKYKLSWAVVGALALLGCAAILLRAGASSASARPLTVPYQRGDVFVGVGAGKVLHHDPNGVLLETLNTTNSSTQDTGVCFDAAGNLYTTNFDAMTMSKFDNHGTLLLPSWGSGFSAPESCIVDSAQHVWVGDSGSGHLLKFDTAGTLLTTYNLAIEHRGIDWIDLAADQCTMYYTSEGQLVKRFNVCTTTQLPDFATGLAARCFALRIRGNGEVMVACESQVYRLDASGATIQTYPRTRYGETSFFFAANLDPDGTSFWTAGFFTGNIFKIDIATGNQLGHFTAPPQGYGTSGLGLYGELVVSQPTPTATATAAATNTATAGSPSPTPRPTETLCPLRFSDVHPADYFYTPVEYLACHGVVSGYADGTFRPYNTTTRAQMIKITVLGFGLPQYTPPPGNYTFTDVPPAFPFFAVIETAAHSNIVNGYNCGTVPNEPCDGQHRPYFRPYVYVTRGQLSKIVVIGAGWLLLNPPQPDFADVQPGTAFYTFVETAYAHGIISGYTCGGPGEPCNPQNQPYFRQYNNATRGQIAKIAFYAVTNP